MTVKLLRGLNEIIAGRSDWQQLSERDRGLGPFDSFEFVLEASRLAVANGQEPVLAILTHSNNEPAAGLALRLTRTVGFGLAQPLGSPIAQYCDAAGDGFTAAQIAVLGSELRRTCKTDLLLLRKVRQGNGLFNALTAAGQSQGVETAAPYIDLHSFGSFAAYEKTFSSGTTRNRRQRRKKLEAEHGALTFATLRGDAAAPFIRLAISWKRQWLSAQGHTSPVFDNGDTQAAFTRIAQQGYVSVLRAGDRPAAIEVGFAKDKHYLAYLGTFDPALSTFSVGQEQMLRTIAWCFDQGFERYDLLAPTDPYKLQWTREPTAVATADFTMPLSLIGRNVSEFRRQARPIARSFIMGLNPKVRAAGRRYAPHTAIVSAALGISAVLAAAD